MKIKLSLAAALSLSQLFGCGGTTKDCFCGGEVVPGCWSECVSSATSTLTAQGGDGGASGTAGGGAGGTGGQ